MSTRKKPTKLRVAPSNAVDQIEALTESLGFGAALPKAQLDTQRSRADAVPVAVIKILAKVAEKNSGSVAGMPFDAADVRDALARADDAQALATAARRLARRATTESIRSRAIVSDRSMAVQLAMSRVVRLEEGAPFVEANDQVRALMRTQSKSGRSRKKSVKAKTSAPTTTAPINGATVADTTTTTAPAVAPVAKPAVTAVTALPT